MPKEAHLIMAALRTQRDEEMLDLVREAIAQLTVLGDRLELYVRESEDHQIEEDVSDVQDVSPS